MSNCGCKVGDVRYRSGCGCCRAWRGRVEYGWIGYVWGLKYNRRNSVASGQQGDASKVHSEEG